MRKHPTRDEYNDIINRAWNANAPRPPCEAAALRSAVKAIWRRNAKRPCPYPVVVTRRGHLRVQYNRDKRRYELLINPRRGWTDAIHDLGHHLHARLHPSDKPHCDRHLEIERDAAAYVVKRYGLASR